MAERKKLGELLLEANLISATQLQSALAHQRQWGVKLGTALLEKGFVDEATLAKFLTTQRGMPSVVLGTLKIPPDVLKRIPRELQEKHMLIPIAVEKTGNRETLVIAMADPSNLQALDEIKFAIGSAKIRTMIAVEVSIKKAILGDTRQFRPSLGAPPPEAPAEITDEFQIVRGTMDTGVGKKAQSPPPVMPGGAPRAAARGVESAPIGEAVLDLDLDLEVSEPEQLDASALEPIVTNVGPPPSAFSAAAPAPRAPAAAPDPFLDALRGPPRQPVSAPARAQAAPMAPAASAAAAVATAPSWPEPAEPSWPPPEQEPEPDLEAELSAAGAVPGVSPFEAPDPEDRTELDIPSAPPPPVALEMPVESFAATVVPAPTPEMPVESWDDAPPAAPAAPADGPWLGEASSETPFEPLAEAAPWPPTDNLDTEPGGIPAASEASDLGPGAVPVMATGMSPLEGSVPEISLPGPEAPEGGWKGDTHVGAFDPDTAPETDLGAVAGAGLFSIPSELEVQEGSIPGEDGMSPSIPEPPMDPEAPPAEWNADAGLEATAADEPMDPAFMAETAISAGPPEMAVESLMPPEEPAASVPYDATAPEYEVEQMAPPEPAADASMDPPMDPSMDPPMEGEAPPAPDVAAEPEPELEPPPQEAPYSSSAGPVPVMTALEAQDNNPEATAIGSGHAEPTWDAPMEFTAPPEGSAVADLRPPPPGPATNIRPEIDEDRNSVTRESPFPHGAEAVRGPAILSPLHVDESAEPAPEAPADLAPEPPQEIPPESPPEVTPPTRQSAVPPPTVRVPGEVLSPPAAPPPPASPPPPAAAVPDISATGPVAMSVTSDEQAALNVLVSKKLKLLNAITEILLEKGLITEDEIKEKISKKKS